MALIRLYKINKIKGNQKKGKERKVKTLMKLVSPGVVLKAALCIAALAALSAASVKNVAVVETEVDIPSGASSIGLTSAEVRLVTTELRREAVKNLPRGKYNIMTTETVYAQGSAVLEECSDENCVIKLGSMIGADYIVRGTLSKLLTAFTLSVEMYETENGNLVAVSDPVRSESVKELIEKAAVVCGDMYRSFVADVWSPAVVSAQATAPVRAPVPAPVQAVTQPFAAYYTLTVRINRAYGGKVSCSPSQESYAPGARVTVKAKPYRGYMFVGWTGAADGMSNPVTVIMDGDKELRADFKEGYILKTKASPYWRGSVYRSPDKALYASGEPVTVTAVPAAGYLFAGWSVEGMVVGEKKPTIVITMDGNIDGYRALTAHFYKPKR